MLLRRKVKQLEKKIKKLNKTIDALKKVEETVIGSIGKGKSRETEITRSKRSHLLKRYPELYGKLNEYALDTDDLEFLFSALALRAGWNCPAVQQLRLLRSIRRLAHLRSDPNSGISLPHSQHAKYGTERCIINSLTPETI